MVRGLKAGEYRTYYGFVDAVISRDDIESPYSREMLFLDCIDAEAFHSGGAKSGYDESLALIRVVSTRRRLAEDYQLPVVTEGDWLELTVAKSPGQPRAWVMPAAAGYVAEKPENIRQIAKLPDPDTSLSEAGKIATSLSQAYSKPPRAVMASDDEVLRLAVALHGPDVRIVALDVGQASCNVVFVGGKPVLYFDAGAPLYHNVRSFPSSFRHNLPDSAFVILSHWDFDHFDLARRKPIMQQYEWFAPAQPVGPNAFKFQERLGDRLHFLTKPLVGPGFRLCAGQATNPKDRNGSGYSLRLEIGDDSILLNGDCPYGQIDPSLQQPGITALTIPHHGGASNSTVPDPQKKSRAVASYGKPNCYKHPSEASLQAHEAKGWNITRTAADPSNSFSRGSRLLFP